MNASSVDKKIYSYLPSLNMEQKKAVLAVVKTFAEPKVENSYSEEFKRDLDERYEDIMSGKGLVPEEEVQERIRQIIKGNKEK